VIELAPPVLVERIERVDLTNTILAKTNADIEDPSSLTFMKVRVQVDATRAVTPESLQAPGQVFAGTVQDGRIDGVFEIRTARPDGAGATAFPVPAGAFDRAELQPFLRPEENIESDDRVIAARARELSAGAESCFAVVERLARWTHDNIAYAIPGGITAKRTMELRAGECGGHSRVLAAMLRSLGIPARTPMGGMYVPLYGGSFGQHMWTEVWLGEAIGWLPVDCTAGQPTFVDASHIRLSERLTAFQPRLVEVLDYAPRPAPGATAARRTDAWPWAAGDSWTYGWSAAGKDLGTEVVTYEGRSDGGHAFASRLELAGGRFVETMRTLVGDDGGVRSLNVERTAGVDKSTFAVAVAGGKARIDAVTPDGERSDSVDVPAAAFVLHNNSILHVALAASRVGRLADGAEVRVRAVHDEARSVLPMSLRGKGIENIEIGGRAVAAQAVAIDLVGIAITVHLDEQGRLVRYQQPRGEFTVELKAP
jgi:transglutaminase-like putative cysteine protease